MGIAAPSPSASSTQHRIVTERRPLWRLAEPTPAVIAQLELLAGPDASKRAGGTARRQPRLFRGQSRELERRAGCFATGTASEFAAMRWSFPKPTDGDRLNAGSV